MDLQFSCPISEVGRIKQFRMCGLNTKSQLYYWMIRIESYLCLHNSLYHIPLPQKLFTSHIAGTRHFIALEFFRVMTYPRGACIVKRNHFILIRT